MKKISLFTGLMLGLFILLCFVSPMKAKAAVVEPIKDASNNVVGDFTNNENGTVVIHYKNQTTLKMKVIVQNADQTYRQIYDMEGDAITVPLTAGNITYTIKLMRNIEGSRYSTVATANFTQNLSDTNEAFLYASAIVNFQYTDEIIKRAGELTKGCKTEREVVTAIHKYVVETLSYNQPFADKINAGNVTSYTPDLYTVYQTKKGICYDYAALLAAMLRSQGIEVRVVTGTPDPATTIRCYHAWNQIYDSATKTWYTVDATYDSTYFHAGRSYTLEKSFNLYSNIKYIY